MSVIVVPLPVRDADPSRRLARIGKETAKRKRHPIHQWDRFPTLLTAAMKHQRFVNVFTSNIVGPTVPWYFAGAKVLEMYQIGPVQGNVPLNVGVLSYDGTLYLDMVADADALPDVNVFADGLIRTLEKLEVLKGLRRSPGQGDVGP